MIETKLSSVPHSLGKKRVVASWSSNLQTLFEIDKTRMMSWMYLVGGHTATFRFPLEMVIKNVILRDFDGNTLSSQVLNWISPNVLLSPSMLLAVRVHRADWGLFYGCVRAVSFSEDVWEIREYKGKTRGMVGFFVLETKNSPNPEYISFSDRVSDQVLSLIGSFLIYIVYCR